MKLKAWPNKLGYDLGKWEIVPHNGVWYANYKPDRVTTKHGQGATYQEALRNAVAIAE
jgi:mannose/cellobiose epimerase-like protein (N-acyl-D-glucosamine 2-epimerase family)